MTNKPVKFEATVPKPWTWFEGAFDLPLFRRMNSELESLFDRFGTDRRFFERTEAAWTPDVEMFEKDNTLYVRADVPGLKKEDITVEMTDDHLVLRGERKHEKEEKGEGFYRAERSYGSFYRALPLPDGVKMEHAKATVHDGVLEVTMPVAKVEEKKRWLEIHEGPSVEKTPKAA
jgi:HSP20 family protein